MSCFLLSWAMRAIFFLRFIRAVLGILFVLLFRVGFCGSGLIIVPLFNSFIGLLFGNKGYLGKHQKRCWRRRPFLGSLKSLAQGFLVATGLIWVFNVAALLCGGDDWLGLLYLLILLIPASSITHLKLRNKNHKPKMTAWRNGETCCFLFKVWLWLFGCLTF